jgi:hypothetical protein
VKDLTPKEKYYARVIWKLRKTDLRKRKKNLNAVLNVTSPNFHSIIQEGNLQNNIPTPRNDTSLLQNDTPNESSISEKQKKETRNRSKLQKDNLRLKEEIETARTPKAF